MSRIKELKNKDNNIIKSGSIAVDSKYILDKEIIINKPENKNLTKSENKRYVKKNEKPSPNTNQVQNDANLQKNNQPLLNNRYNNPNITTPLYSMSKENLSRNYTNNNNFANGTTESNIKSILNPFDSINSNLLQSKQFLGSINDQINNIISSDPKKLSQRSNDSYLKISQRSRKNFNSFNNESSKDTPFEITINSNDVNSNDIHEGNNYISMSGNNYFNSNNFITNNKKGKIQEIKEDDEEDYCDTKSEFLSSIKLLDLESYVQKFKYNNNVKRSAFEFSYRLSNIINNSPFNNIRIPLNSKKEADINNLLAISNIVNIKMLNSEQITEKFNQDFYGQILSAKSFANLNVNLHDEKNFDSSSISISQLHSFNSNYINNNKLLINKKVRDVTSNDGNSFIKAFIFNYFENIILSSKSDSLTCIIYIISTKLTIFKDENGNNLNLNIQEILNILKIIFSHIENKNISEAYIVLINAFKENSEFEKGLVYLVKYSLAQFITYNYILFNIDYLKEIIPDSDKYFCNDTSFNYKLYINENILPYREELQYNILIYYLLPLIFHINLIIYTNNNSKNLNKIIFKDESNQNNTNNNRNNSIITLELIVYFGNTSILYNDDFYNKYKNSIIYISDYQYPLDKIQLISNNDNKNLLCDICNTALNKSIQVGEKIKPICSKCFKDYILKVINKKYSLLKDDYYFHEEYYCSKIKLTNASENNLYLSLNDIKILLPNHNNISEEIHSKILSEISCDKCNVKFINKKYCICLNPCGHLICNDCFTSYIKNITHNKIILNKYELKTEVIEFKCLYCSSIIQSLNKFIYNYFEDINEHIENAEERFITQAKTMCCVCQKVSNKYSFTVPINDNINGNQKYLKHSLCVKCKIYYDSQLKNNIKRSYQTKLPCWFCDEAHIYNILDLEVKQIKNESCCIIN